MALPVKPRLVFVDGRDRIDAGCDCEAVIGGDGLVASIAAASIVAKVTRDRLMACLGAAHPGYGFERHMGYSVPEHFAALDRLGPTMHHRRSFSPVAIAFGLIWPPMTRRSADRRPYCPSRRAGRPSMTQRAIVPQAPRCRVIGASSSAMIWPDVLRPALR